MQHEIFAQTNTVTNVNQALVQEFRDFLVSHGLNDQAVKKFQEIIYDYYYTHRRDFVWREQINPYYVLVSEIMLQQTQTDRVSQKFIDFVTRFPDFSTLAHAPFDEVLRYWKGLGYNRRALYIHKIAQKVTNDFGGVLPNDPEILETFAGIGHNTASSICAFAFNRPTVFIETNIRTVYIYLFGANITQNVKRLASKSAHPELVEGAKASTLVHDKELMPLVAKTLDLNSPRDWYYALMDYGVMLKKTVGNVSRLSKHYTKQSKFQGSDRQIRGIILQVLLDYPGISEQEIIERTGKEQARVPALRSYEPIGEERSRVLKMLEALCNEGFVKKSGQILLLAT
ncbi:MAG: A/G-specific adenine glycosylase [bacterium]